MSNFAIEAMVLGFLAALAGVLVLVARFARKHFYRVSRAAASIDEIHPIFRQDEPDRTTYVQVRFSFSVSGKHYTGAAVVPLGHFLEEAREGELFIFREKELDLPIMRFKGDAITGEEAIEHCLLQNKDMLFINYRARRSGKEFSVEKIDTRKERVN